MKNSSRPLFIDLNCDMGESFGRYTLGQDEAVMPHITSANVACGFHAGDPQVMRRTLRLARAAGVAVGAHPGFPDLAGFGRRDLSVTPGEAEDLVLYQVAALAGMAAAEGVALQHVKPHGALYTMACRERTLADAIARAVVSFDRSLILFGLPESALLAAGRDAGLRVATEAFADRGYESDGTLTPRAMPGAVLHDLDAVTRRAVQMVRDRTVVASNGRPIAIEADTLCVHGDTPGAAALAERLRAAFTAAGVEVVALNRQSGARE